MRTHQETIAQETQETLARDELASLLKQQPRQTSSGFLTGLLAGGALVYGAFAIATGKPLPFATYSASQNQPAPARALPSPPMPSTAMSSTTTLSALTSSDALASLIKRVDELQRAIEQPRSYAALADSIRSYITERTVVERVPQFDAARVATIVREELTISPQIRALRLSIDSSTRQAAQINNKLHNLEHLITEVAPLVYFRTTTQEGRDCVVGTLYNHNPQRRQYSNAREVLLCAPEGE